MLNASVGMQRVLGRLRTDQRTRSPLAIRLHRRTVNAAQAVHEAVVTRIAGSRSGAVAVDAVEPQAVDVAPARSVRTSTAVRLRLAVRRRVGRETALPVAVASIVLASSLLSVLPDAIPAGPVGGPVGDGVGPRIAVGGQGTVLGAFDQAGEPIAGSVTGPRFRAIDPEALAIREEPSPSTEPVVTGAFLDDGTLIKPVAVDTSIADGSDLLRTYTVKKGDTLVAIADAHGVSMMSVWWANSAKIGTKESLPAGTVLTIPPVTGLIHQVKEGDSLDSLATKYKIEADAIYEVNGLEDRALVIGQTLVLPGAAGDPIPTPKPTVRPRSGGSTRAVAGPTSYAGGSFGWPVAGGGNYISQYFRSGHYGLDIAADYGSSVMAGGAGTVIFAGWKNNGGGYQVWIAHGSGLYTTYNHMSAVTVGAGQSVGRGQQVGRIGQSGWATGPHLHFEVWRGEIWNGGRRVNPLLYL